MSRGPSARLAICVPVHHGRAIPLAELFGHLMPQLPEDDSVEICISDNASRDGTSELVARMRERLGGRVRYQRHEADRGLTANVLSAVQMASAEHCWLMGSDDAPAPGAVAAIQSILGRNPDLSGLSLGASRRLGEGMREQGTDVDMWPRGTAERRLTEPGEIARACGLTQLALSANVVRRDRWQEAVEADRELIEGHPLVPHMCAIAGMIAWDPNWMICPSTFFYSRQGTIFLEESDHYRGSPVRQWTDVSRQMLSLWRAVHPPQTRADLLEWLRRLAWSPALSAAYRGLEASGRRDFRSRLKAVRLLAGSAEFRRTSARLLLAPERRLSLAASPTPERPPAMRAALGASPPAPLVGGRGAWIDVDVRAAGEESLAYFHRSRLALFTSWSGPGGAPVAIAPDAHTPIVPSIRAGAVRRYPVFVSVPLAPGTYELTIDLLSSNGGWSAAEAPLRLTVQVESAALPES